MNAQYLDRARAAYRAGDYAAAAQIFAAVKEPSEPAGEVDHLRGNALMKLGRYADAASAYELALADRTYGKRGALLTNQGKAYAAAGEMERAVSSFSEAARDASYATPYKAYFGLGTSLRALGNVAEAGTAFRQAAIDGANPAPAGALAQLGACFIDLGRPGDAIESYRTALDFATPRDDVRAINAGMGRAYEAAGRHADAVEVFNAATADGIYQLSTDEEDALARAQDAVAAASAQNAMGPAPTAGLGEAVDPLDPLGQSGSFMPDPSDTGFFTMSESELIQQDRREMKVRRKKRRTGLKVFLVILLLVIIAGGGLGFAYTRGFGFPSQQSVLTSLFDAVTDGEDTDAYLDASLSDSAKSLLVSMIPEGATPTIDAMDQSMTESTAQVTVTLSLGGTQVYDVTFVRSENHIGWVVSSLSLSFDSTTTDDDATDDADAGDETADATDDEAAA